MKLRHILFGLLLSCTDKVDNKRPSLRIDTEERTPPEDSEGSAIFDKYRVDGAAPSPPDGGVQRNFSPDGYSSQWRYDGATLASDSSVVPDSSTVLPDATTTLDALISDSYSPSSGCPYEPYDGEETCDGIDNDGDGLVDRALLNGETNPLYDQRICPARCYTLDSGHVVEERLDYLGNIEDRTVRSDYCDPAIGGRMLHYQCNWDYNCIGQWGFLYERWCGGAGCIDPDGYPGTLVEAPDQSGNIPAQCDEL